MAGGGRDVGGPHVSGHRPTCAPTTAVKNQSSVVGSMTGLGVISSNATGKVLHFWLSGKGLAFFCHSEVNFRGGPCP